MRRTVDIDALEDVLCAALGSREPVCSPTRLGRDADAFAALDPAVGERPTLVGGGAPYAPSTPAPARPALDELLRRAEALGVPQALVPGVRRSDDVSALRAAGFVPVAADPECVFRLAGDVDEALRTRVGADRLGELRRRHGDAAREVRWERIPLRELDGHASARDAFIALHESAAPLGGTGPYNAAALDALARGPLAERTTVLVARRGSAVVQAGLLTRSHNGRGVYCLTLATYDDGPGAARDLREAGLYEVYVEAQRSGLDWVHLGRGDAGRMRGLGADLFVPVDHWLRAPGLTPAAADTGEPALSAFAAPPVASVPVPGPARFRRQPRFDVVDLSSNTNPFLGSASRYPELDTEELARTYLSTVARLPGHEGIGALSADHVLFTSGAVDGALLLLAALASPGERVCVTSPTFPLYDHFARVLRLPVVDVPLRGEDLDELDVERILAAEPRVTLLCDPNNPVGTRLDEARVHALVAGGQGLVVIDEAYVEFSEKPSYAGLVARHDNLIVLRTLSKAWGLASARCGVVLAQPGVVDALRRVQVPFGFTDASQRAVRDRLTDAPRVLYSVRRIRAEREWMAAALADHPAVERVFPSETNFLLVRLHKHERVMDRLHEAGILVADTGRGIPDTCRISIGDRRANNSLLAALSAAL
ncbi:aminotransferase class I/II-fold pyridoxal phosphate-dependent enzyme [Streptomyces spectabilis]|uniref:histidinol-phosphate transaminase n=1 Tax=Streptomyces spectabilis TaxID=68270 RepID=A0A516R2M3_STRST|nr:aminotransferase class I/II-fold pyridoxal phosphate-dependent enzyme [Streptomyces spectabilis]QDQ09891.1 aminotransferase class I/II-fold pyridoxal phosphate-dependent enzyme [Streptomyces spectabilis]